MKTENELIAEFDGWTLSKIDEFNRESPYTYARKNSPYSIKFIDDLRYSTSWDWLMPVVEKFYTIEASVFNYNVSSMTELRLKQEILEAFSIVTPINTVYKALVSNIKWYNTQQPPQKSQPSTLNESPNELGPSSDR